MSAQTSDAKVVDITRAEKSEPQMAAAPVTAAPIAPKKKRGGRIIFMALVPVALAGAGAYFYLNGGRYEETDNAYMQQAKVSVSADIAGRVTSVNVSENQSVKAGAVLFTLDPQSFQIALNQANAALGSARVNVEQLKVSYGTAQANLRAAQSTLELQQTTFDRQSSLAEQGVAAQSTLDQPKLALQQAQTAVVTAQQQVANAIAALGGSADIVTDQHPAVQAAQAQVEQAEHNLSKTTVVAPADGIIAQVSSLNVGQYVGAGSAIASLVESQGTWIEANFKETQLTAIKVGMPAEIKADAFPGQPIEGHVVSIGAATGAEFALIPAQNATGNWVKVVQRIPVRIEFDGDAEGLLLRSGMSAVVSVDTGLTTLDKMQGLTVHH